MNFNQLIETVWDHMGVQSAGDRRDCTLQAIRYGINQSLMELSRSMLSLGYLRREKTITLVAGTATYQLDDWCRVLHSLYTTDSNAGKVHFRQEKIADIEGLRSSSLSLASGGPYDAIMWERTLTAAKSGTVGAISEAGTAFTKTGGSDLVSADDVGKMMRFKGEDTDYAISAVGGVNACTIDKAHRGFLTGNGTSGAASNYSGVKWEVSPPGRIRFRFLPAPAASGTMYYRGTFYPRRLVNADETPELLDDYHDLLWKGALKHVGLRGKDWEAVAGFHREYQTALESLKATNADQESDVHDRPVIESLLNGQPDLSKYSGGVYWRNHGGYLR
jgi:hypothetical protein